MRNLCCFLLGFVFLLATVQAEDTVTADDVCEWTRADAHECVLRHADDVDENGKLDAREISIFKKKLLGWFGSDLFSVVRAITPDKWLKQYTVEEIMRRCADDEGYVTLRSFKERQEHCLAHCKDWTGFMKLCTSLDKTPHHYPHHKIDKLGSHPFHKRAE